jgi:outer membrane protein TolC
VIDSALNRDHQLIDQQIEIGQTRIDQQKLRESNLPRVTVSAADAFMLSSFAIKSTEINIPELNIAIKEGSNRFTMTSMLAVANGNASMLLYSGGKIPQLKKALNAKEKAQREMLESDRQKIISNILAAYDQISLLRQIKKVLDESGRRLEADKKNADKALGYGLITAYEHQKIEVAQAQLASRMEDYNGKKELVEEQLFLLTDIDKSRIRLINDSLHTIESVPEINSIMGRAEIRALDASILAARYSLNAQKTWFVPKIEATSSLGYLGLLDGHISSSNPVSPAGKLSASFPNLNVLPLFNVGIGVKWDVFDGKVGKREVQKAELDIHKVENQRQQAIEDLELNLAKCHSDYTSAISKVILLRTQRQTAANALDQASREYRTGLIRTNQLVEAEEDFQNAELGCIQAIYNQRRAAISLLQATGTLTLQSLSIP